MHKVDDGRTGSFLRERHNLNENGALVLDNRCGECQALIDKVLECEREATFFGEGDRPTVNQVQWFLRNRGERDYAHSLRKADGSYGVGL